MKAIIAVSKGVVLGVLIIATDILLSSCAAHQFADGSWSFNLDGDQVAKAIVTFEK